MKEPFEMFCLFCTNGLLRVAAYAKSGTKTGTDPALKNSRCGL